jgi:Transposase and inactivated derivatives
MAYKAHRAGVAARFPDPAGQKSIAVDLALIDHDDQLLMDLELPIVRTAKPHDANTRYRRPTVPGIGKRFSLVLLDAIHDMDRFPRGQDFASYCRLVQCAKASAGKRDGTSGTKIGNASLTWAFSAAAVLFWRNHPTGQIFLARLEHKHGKGKALTVLAHKLARAVYDMLQRDTVFAMDKFLNSERSRAGEPDASLDHHGISLHTCPWNTWTLLRHRTRRRTLARLPDPVRLMGYPLWLWYMRRESSTVSVGCLSPAPGSHWRTRHGQPPFCRGR